MPIHPTTLEPNSPAELTQLSDVSAAMMRVYAEQFGREPARAHSHYVGADAIACFLRGTLTRAERRLSTLDEHQRLRSVALRAVVNH